MLQREIDIKQMLETTHGLLIETIVRNARNAGRLFKYCESNSITDLAFRSYYASKDEFGETQCHVLSDVGWHDLDDPANVPWAHVKKDSKIQIKILLNIAFVFGQGEDAQTLLHELDVHALEYLPFIERMREAPERSIQGIWTAAIGGSSSGVAQHRRLARGNRALSADVQNVAQATGLATEMSAIQSGDQAAHQHYLGQPN